MLTKQPNVGVNLQVATSYPLIASGKILKPDLGYLARNPDIMNGVPHSGWCVELNYPNWKAAATPEAIKTALTELIVAGVLLPQNSVTPLNVTFEGLDSLEGMIPEGAFRRNPIIMVIGKGSGAIAKLLPISTYDSSSSAELKELGVGNLAVVLGPANNYFFNENSGQTIITLKNSTNPDFIEIDTLIQPDRVSILVEVEYQDAFHQILRYKSTHGGPIVEAKLNGLDANITTIACELGDLPEFVVAVTIANLSLKSTYDDTKRGFIEAVEGVDISQQLGAEGRIPVLTLPKVSNYLMFDILLSDVNLVDSVSLDFDDPKKEIVLVIGETSITIPFHVLTTFEGTGMRAAII